MQAGGAPESSLPREEHELGFTLLELMIVVIVLGILAGLVMLGVGPFASASASAVCRSEIDTLHTANASYIVRHGIDAPSADALLDEGILERAPKYVTITDGETDPATDAECEESFATDDTTTTTVEDTTTTSVDTTTTTTTIDDTTSTTSSTTSTTAPLPPVYVTALVGVGDINGRSDNWSTVITVTVDGGLSDVTVTGSWSDGRNPNACTTLAGTCTISTNHTTSSSATWTVNSVVKTGYQQGTNAKTTVACAFNNLLCTVS